MPAVDFFAQESSSPPPFTKSRPVLVSMPEPPAARYAVSADGFTNPSVVWYERRRMVTKSVITTFVNVVPFLETMMSGNARARILGAVIKKIGPLTTSRDGRM